MKTIRRNLDEIGGAELNKKQKGQLHGGAELLKCFYCVCTNSTGTWVTKAEDEDTAEATGGDRCQSGVASCGEVPMWQCWGID
jgi:hypothetical protein